MKHKWINKEEVKKKQDEVHNNFLKLEGNDSTWHVTEEGRIRPRPNDEGKIRPSSDKQPPAEWYEPKPLQPVEAELKCDITKESKDKSLCTKVDVGSIIEEVKCDSRTSGEIKCIVPIHMCTRPEHLKCGDNGCAIHPQKCNINPETCDNKEFCTLRISNSFKNANSDSYDKQLMQWKKLLLSSGNKHDDDIEEDNDNIRDDMKGRTMSGSLDAKENTSMCDVTVRTTPEHQDMFKTMFDSDFVEKTTYTTFKMPSDKEQTITMPISLYNHVMAQAENQRRTLHHFVTELERMQVDGSGTHAERVCLLMQVKFSLDTLGHVLESIANLSKQK